ncbi:MAG TPA: phosphate starvation-inducible protein PhoH [Firmicutes bacterium]|nr:phosphate starvation-inducible protein PhoH [Bacillota bacterium]
MTQTAEARLRLPTNGEAIRLAGTADEYFRLIEKKFGVAIRPRGNEVAVFGSAEAVAAARRVLEDLAALSRKQDFLSPQDVRAAVELASEDSPVQFSDLSNDVLIVTARGRAIVPRSMGQKEYVEAMRNHALVFAIGPAGTGKTYLAVAMAAAALKKKEVARLVLTRPAVEAGEKLGFLPGDLQEKVDPYLRPLYDALYDTLGTEGFQRHMERGLIEVAPLAYMRGRTLDDAFIILDEAQNTTPEQMKMFLTRMGFGSRVVVTGDVTQVDLPKGQRSGLLEVTEVLRGVEGVAFVYLNERDVVRHELVQRIIRAYDRFEKGIRGEAGSGELTG